MNLKFYSCDTEEVAKTKKPGTMPWTRIAMKDLLLQKDDVIAPLVIPKMTEVNGKGYATVTFILVGGLFLGHAFKLPKVKFPYYSTVDPCRYFVHAMPYTRKNIDNEKLVRDAHAHWSKFGGVVFEPAAV
jgi:hypothetical protein